MSRWLSVSALVYAGWVIYACALGFTMRALDPDIAEFQPSHFFLAGSVAAALLSPVTGFFILRAVHRRSELPRDEERWWWRAHRMTIEMLGIVTVFAAVGALVGWGTGSASSGLCFGTCLGAVLTAAPTSASA